MKTIHDIHIGQEDIYQVSKVFIIAMIQTNVDEMNLTQEHFRGPDGTDYGDYKITVSKISHSNVCPQTIKS